MSSDADLIHQSFLKRLRNGDLPENDPTDSAENGLDKDLLLEIFKSQLLSRHLDFQSRKLQARGESFYTIGSAGHEGNAAIAAAFRVTDMAFLHYRDAAFFIQRAKQHGDNPTLDLLLSFAASSDDPIAGGRHKVLGSKVLYIPPQTSTIASHLPKAVGAAASIGIRKRCRLEGGPLPDDGVILCSFGDASLNHSTAQGAINTASWMAYRKMHVPLLFICEDNGIGISVPTPLGWVEASMRGKPGIRYFACDGLNIADTYRAAREAEQYVRQKRLPAFLHMRCVRLMGHAGSDVQGTYLSEAEINAMHASDPLLHSAALVLEHGICSTEEILALYEDTAQEVARAAEIAITKPKLSSAAEVMECIVPPKRASNRVAVRDTMLPDGADKPQPMSRLINLALHDLMRRFPHIILAGEDIGKKGGVYGVTTKLGAAFGSHRGIDTLLDEQSILGLAIGMAHNGLLPIVEIQFLAYLHNAEDQLRGEAATLSFFSKGQFTNPMVVRMAGLGYQKGFGGHFHNDNSIAVLRDIPGIIVACPSNGADAAGMLCECVRLAEEEQRVVVFLEPIALYTARDLHEAGDNLWCGSYEAAAKRAIPFGEVAQEGDGALAIVTYGNGYYLSRQAAEILKSRHGVSVKVIDLRWLSPLPVASVIKAIRSCLHVLIVDECRKTGSLSEELFTRLTEESNGNVAIERLCAEDSFIPLGRASTLTLPNKEQIVTASLKLLGHS